jgi:uncharacterized protein (DUF111 family)
LTFDFDLLPLRQHCFYFRPLGGEGARPTWAAILAMLAIDKGAPNSIA